MQSHRPGKPEEFRSRAVSQEANSTLGTLILKPSDFYNVRINYYGSSETILRYSLSVKAVSVSVLTAPLDAVARTIFADVSGLGASTITIMS